MKKCLFLFLVAALIMSSTSLLTAQQICSSQTGTNNGFYYEHWTDGTGTACMTLGSGGTFSNTWTNCGNFVSRKGRSYDDTQTYTQLGNITITYACTYNPSGNSYLAVYGWTHQPLIEFYVVEGWGNWRPPGASSMGTVNIDGGTYDIYRTTRVNQPSIEGTATFDQFWSVRTVSKTSGTISVTQHFQAWAAKGMTLGKFHECSMAVEGYQSSGNSNMTTLTFSSGTTTPPTPTRTATMTPTRTATAVVNNKGDVNSDGTITIVDALMLAQYVVGLNPSGFDQSRADVNCDGTITIVDALMIAQRVVGLISAFPC